MFGHAGTVACEAMGDVDGESPDLSGGISWPLLAGMQEWSPGCEMSQGNPVRDGNAAAAQVAKRAADLLAAADNKRHCNVSPTSIGQPANMSPAVGPQCAGQASTCSKEGTGEAVPPGPVSPDDARAACQAVMQAWQRKLFASPSQETQRCSPGSSAESQAAVPEPPPVSSAAGPAGALQREASSGAANPAALQDEIANLRQLVAELRGVHSDLAESVEDLQMRAILPVLEEQKSASSTTQGPSVPSTLVSATPPPPWVLAAIRCSTGPEDFIWRFVFSDDDKTRWLQRGIPEPQASLMLRAAPLLSHCWVEPASKLIQWWDGIYSLGQQADRWDPTTFQPMSGSFQEPAMPPPSKVPAHKACNRP